MCVQRRGWARACAAALSRPHCSPTCALLRAARAPAAATLLRAAAQPRAALSWGHRPWALALARPSRPAYPLWLLWWCAEATRASATREIACRVTPSATPHQLYSALGRVTSYHRASNISHSPASRQAHESGCPTDLRPLGRRL